MPNNKNWMVTYNLKKNNQDKKQHNNKTINIFSRWLQSDIRTKSRNFHNLQCNKFKRNKNSSQFITKNKRIRIAYSRVKDKLKNKNKNKSHKSKKLIQKNIFIYYLKFKWVKYNMVSNTVKIELNLLALSFLILSFIKECPLLLKFKLINY